MSPFPNFIQYLLWILIAVFLFSGCESKRVKRAERRFLDENALGDVSFECDSDDPVDCECDVAEFGFPHCEPCDCYYGGTELKVCDEVTGECLCLPNFGDDSCDHCAPGYYALPDCNNTCNCSEFGSKNTTCDRHTGICPCKLNYAGDKCDECAIGYEHYPKCEMNCDPPDDMMRMIKNSKYMIRYDQGPVPDTSLPHHFLTVKNYCEAHKLKLPTIQHHTDYISLQEHILALAREHPKRYEDVDGGHKKTNKMVYLDIKFHSEKRFHSEQNYSAPVYLYWDYYANKHQSEELQPHFMGRYTTRVVADAVKYSQKWQNIETPCEEWKKHWMGLSTVNENLPAVFAPLVVCQFPEGSECHKKSFEEQQNKKAIAEEEEKKEWKGVDILGWINGHLIWVSKFPSAYDDQVKACTKMKGMPLFLEYLRFAGWWGPLQHKVIGGDNQTNLKMLRDYYVCRNVKNDVQPLSQLWFTSCFNCYTDILDEYQLTFKDYSPESKAVEYSINLPDFAFQGGGLNGINVLCYCEEKDCQYSYPKDKNACNP